jgi:hypothetical protein
MGKLIDRFTALFRREAPEQVTTTSDEMPRPSRPMAAMNRFQAERGRQAVVKISRKMYAEDPRARASMATVARDATRGGFQVQVTEGAEADRAQEIAGDLATRLKLFGRLDDWTRLAFRDGDSFLEVSVDEEGLVQAVTRKPTLEMVRNSNRQDRFEDPRRAFWWADQMWAGQAAPRDAVWFAAWQIIHARWMHDEGSRYGTPQFASAQTPWKRVTEGEYDVAVRRKTRAGLKYLHTLEDADDGAIQKYREENKDALNDPFAAVADFFTNSKASVQVLQGDARLAEIADVVHHIETWGVASVVPLALLGYGQNLNRDVLEEKKAQYDETLPLVSEWVEREIVVPLLERQWLLQGIWPEGLTYRITWSVRETLTAARLESLGKALAALQATALFDEETLIRMAARMVPGLDVDALLAALARARAERPYY